MLLKDIPKTPIQENIFSPLSRLYAKGYSETPNKTAITDGRNSYTFEDLELRSDALFKKLLAAQVVKGDRIVVLGQKKIEMAIIAPAIWKAGAIYVPLDSDNPKERLKGIISDTEAKVVIGANTQLESDFRELNSTKISFESIAEDPLNSSDYLEYIDVDLDDIAYMIHTSGTTGKPKGVCISHGNLRSYFINHNEIFNFNKESFCFSFSPFHFDVSIEDTFLPMAFGASVYCYKGLPIQSLILKALEKSKITHVIAVSTILTIMTTDKQKVLKTDLSHLRLLMTGAEVCDTDVIDFWNNNFPNIELINAYGPTETTIVSHCYTIPKRVKEDKSTFYPIGKPLSNTTSVLLDDLGQIINNPNQVGELLIGGTQVMKGYYNRLQETEEALVDLEGELFYRSGDLCFYDKEGNYNFVGRTDDEVKLFGRRVNLLAIQNELLAASEFENGAINVLEIKGQKKVFAIVVGDLESQSFLLPILEEKLRSKLPHYMVPSYFAITQSALLSSTGKNNLKSLLSSLSKSLSENSGKFFQITNNNIKQLDF